MSERSERIRSMRSRSPWGCAAHARTRMRRAIYAFAFVAAAGGGVAFADDTRVRSSATVEVLDDKAQIDDVISRMKMQPPARETHATAASSAAAAGTLKQERPPANIENGQHRPVGPEAKDQRPGTRRSNRDRVGNPDHTERPRHHRR